MSDPTDALTLDDSEAANLAKAKIQRQQEVEDLKWLMAHAQGRRIVTRLFEFTGIRRTSFHTNGSMFALNEGKKQAGLWLEAEVLDAAPDAYLKLLKEFARNE